MQTNQRQDKRIKDVHQVAGRRSLVVLFLMILWTGVNVSCTPLAPAADTTVSQGSQVDRVSEEVPDVIIPSTEKSVTSEIETSASGTGDSETSEITPGASETTLPETSMNDEWTEWISTLTIEEKVGQLLIFGYESVQEAEAVIREIHPGGVILFGRNIQSLEQTRSDLLRLQSAATSGSDASLPLWISVDQEGGRVSRLPAEAGLFESARELGSRDDPENTFAYGQRTSLVLADLGFNLDFAPVLDIDSNPQNPVIGDRSFGSTAEVVSRHGLAMLSGLESGGILACVKHFPGHGDTLVDSHLGLPVVSKDLADLQSFELVPFAEAIAAGVSMIMVGHLQVVTMDRRPASLSPLLVDNLLRDQMGYQGVVITDDLTMGAIVENYSLAEAGIMAIEAGCDLLPVCHGTDRLREVQAALLAACRDGRLSEARIDQSVRRIWLLKQKMMRRG